jgi:uncharacterized iron-regulated protein
MNLMLITFSQKLNSMFILKFYVHAFIYFFFISSIFPGCASSPQKLMLTDLKQTFPQDTIISAKLKQQIAFETFMENLNSVTLIYIGERHLDKNHHDIQLKVIKSLYETNPALCVAMEMFDKSYQHVLDQWTEGRLDEAEFLKKTHWYANWRYRFDLYRDILLFIRENHIQLIGLNIPFHIPPKIAIGGIENLLDHDKKFLPETINTDIEPHREYVKQFFEDHMTRGRENFDTFYEAQCVWEDIMAETIADHLCDGPMVVLAGNGHIIRKFGIPDRAFQLKPLPFKTIYLAPAGTTAELGYADYIWVTPEPQTPH